MFTKALYITLFVGMLFSIMPDTQCQETAQEKAQQETPPAKPALPDIVAVVGDEVITGESFQKDLEYRWQQIPPQARKGITEPQFRNQILQERIDGIVILSLASMSGVTVSAQEVQEALKALRADYYSEESFTALLEKEGIIEAQLNKDIHTKILREKYIAHATKDITISEEELHAEYETMKAQGQVQRPSETLDIGYFFIAVQSNLPEEWEHDYKRIEALYQRIEAGEDYSVVLRSAFPPLFALTPDCIYEEVPIVMLPREVQKTLSIMNEGALAKPFRSLAGWHLVKLFKRNPPGEVSFEKAKTTLRKRLFETRKNEHIQTLIDQHKLVLNIDVKQQ